MTKTSFLKAASIAVVWLFSTTCLAAEQPIPCEPCAAWNETRAPFRIFGNTYYVGMQGVSSILITSGKGHVLIDGALPESAAKIAASVRALGFKVEDIKLILNSHVHFDHAGGIAELRRLSAAAVAASESSAKVLRQGFSGPDDPQYGALPPIPVVSKVRPIKNGEKLHVGPIELTAHLTPGHTPGGTSWSWRSCEKERCLRVVYADSLNAVSAKGFKFSHNETYPQALSDLEKSFSLVSSMQCDILLAPHPQRMDLWARLAKSESGKNPDAFVDASACRRYVEAAQTLLTKRLEEENSH